MLYMAFILLVILWAVCLFIGPFFFRLKWSGFLKQCPLFTVVFPSPLCLTVNSCCVHTHTHTHWPLTHQTMKKGRLHPHSKPSYNSCIGDTQTHSLLTRTHRTHMDTPVCLLALLLNDISSTVRTWRVGGNLILHPFLSPWQRNSFILC